MSNWHTYSVGFLFSGKLNLVFMFITVGLNISSNAEFYEHLHMFLYGDPSTGQSTPGAAFIRDIVFNTSNITQPRYILVRHFLKISTENNNEIVEILTIFNEYRWYKYEIVVNNNYIF